ncbi:MAG: glycosyltransferase family 1 protein [Nitrospirae bacterium]|nr:glycosyltransferase family 1 protein [Nitrospirota bacterium]
MFAQTWAGYIDPRIFSEIRNTYGTIIINIAMDDRHQYWGKKVNGEWWGTYGLIPHIDLALTAAPECTDWYLKEGCPAIFFPEASDPDIFHPMANLPKIHEVSFVGARYGIREKVILALRKAGIHVTAYGSGWENGRLENKEVPILFAQSKIVLGVGSIGYCEDFFALKIRDFDGPMSGSFYLTDDNPDLYSLYDVGKEIMTYRGVKNCVDRVLYYFKNEKQRETIAFAGYNRARQHHTWQIRFEELIKFLSLVNNK